jgi:hypothetical protein
VWNGEESLATSIDSVLAQTFEDFEILISDNASDDGTRGISEEFAIADDRIRYVRNAENIGQNQNFRQVLTIFRGEMVRLMSVGDTLAPGYLEATVAAMAATPEAVLATTDQLHVTEGEAVHTVEYRGVRPDSADPIERLDEILRLLSSRTPFQIDPVYSLIRGSALAHTGLIRPIRFGDQTLAAELALQGPYVHVPETLSQRRWDPLPSGSEALRRYTGAESRGLKGEAQAALQRPLMIRYIAGQLLSRSDLTAAQRARGLTVIGAYAARLGRRRLGNLGRKLSPSSP